MTSRRSCTRALVPLCFATLVLASAACTGDPVEASDLVHVHDLIVDQGQPTYVAAHTGLLEVRETGIVRVDDALDDLMAATRSDDGELMASGHPQLDDDRLRAPGAPPLLGLVVRDDGAWQPRSLLGEADFHALVTHGDLVIGADGTSGAVLVSTDAGNTWQPRGAVELVALAMAPTDTEQLAGVTYEGTVVISDDGARTWREVDAVDDAVDVAWSRSGPVVLTGPGVVQGLADGDARRLSTLPGAAAITADDDALIAFVPPTGLWTSADGGRTWEDTR